MNLNFKKFIFSIFFTFFFSLFNTPQIDGGPVSSDDYQYWTLATHLAKTGNYGYINESDYDETDFYNPLNNAGIRRGEVLYPFFISTVIKVTTSDSELGSIDADCIYEINDGLCSVLGGSTVLLNIVFLIAKYLLIFFVAYLLYDRCSKGKIAFISFFMGTTLIYTNKDFLTFALLFFYFISFLDIFESKLKNLFKYFSLSLLPLTNPIFYYYLFINFSLESLKMIKKGKINTLKILILILCFLPSVLWSMRNYYHTDEFTITSRSSEIIGIRAEFLSIEYGDIPAGLVYYTPGNGITNVFKGYLWDKVGSSENWELLFDRSYEDSKLRLGHQKRGAVFERMKENIGIINVQDITYQSIVQQNGHSYATNEYRKASFDLINENKLKYLSTSTIFFYRGLFPEINQLRDSLKEYDIGEFFNQIIILFRMFPIIFAFYIIFKNFKYFLSREEMYLFLFIYSGYGLLTHFIPRYSTLLVPFSIYLFIKLCIKDKFETNLSI